LLSHPPIITPIGVQRQALLTERLPIDAGFGLRGVNRHLCSITLKTELN
jgi:hypothetical protein